MQIANVNTTPMKTTTGTSTTSSTPTGDMVSSKFGEVFSKVMTNLNNQDIATTSVPNASINLEQLTELVNANSLEDVLGLLGITHDDGLLMVDVKENGQAKSIDEMMNLKDILEVLNIDADQLNKVMQQLLDDDSFVVTDIWQFIETINELAPKLISELTIALQGKQNVSPKEAEQVVQFMKLAQIVGKNSDLIYDQSTQLAKLKDVLTELSKNIVETIAKPMQTHASTTQTTTANYETTRMPIQGLKVVKQTETTTESTQSTAPVQHSTTTSVKTITITLPTEKGAQGDALVKEFQNLVSRSQLTNTQGTMKLLLKLYPENLGSIRIEIMQQDGVLTAKLLASTPQAKELLDSQLNQLKSAFAQANIQMDRIDITQSLQETDRNFRDQSLFGNLFKQQQNQNEQDDEQELEEEEMSFQEYLMNEGV